MYCDYCDEKIENGMEYFHLNNLIVCEDCLDDFLKDVRKTYEDDEEWAEAEREVQEYIEGIER